MTRILPLLFVCLLTSLPLHAQDPVPVIEDHTSHMVSMDGYFTLYWDESSGKLLIEIDRFDEDFLYQTSMPRGVGSNDLGLDRGQLGSTQVTRFVRSGPKVLLIADNLDYRASSDNEDEIDAVEQSFAESVLWGFEISAESGDRVLVDATAFFTRDSHGLATRLKVTNQGNYSLDRSRSAIFLDRTRSFPDNSEIEAIVTFTGQPNRDAGASLVLPTVVPDANAVTVHLHHSLIRLPDDDYIPVAYDPRAGLFGTPYGNGYIDYSSTIGEPMRVKFANTHRLRKKDPSAEVSEAVEPIIYYLDRGAPEPVRSALIEGAQWWNQAFEAAGYKDAFQVRILPPDADPMDVRYNVIQWVHRSTRGWSYGGSVVDPRTGEIIKGHVTLGSLRVRQDYLIAEGLLSPYAQESYSDSMLEMSLARIRQLSAHEVGHTIGIEHNFAASVNDRSSVMDYPFPLISLDSNGHVDLSDAYDVGIGAWDKRVVMYAYQDFPEGTDRNAARNQILMDTINSGLLYVADQDSRDPGSAHPQANLWDNGEDAVAQLRFLGEVREAALSRFSLDTIRTNRPEATLEEALVPIYLLHRFQIQAAAKFLGGQYFQYTLKGDGQDGPTLVDAGKQMDALDALIETLNPEFLALPDGLAQAITPRPPGHARTRESFDRNTGTIFDPLSPASASVRLTLDVLLHPARLSRMNRQSFDDREMPSASVISNKLMSATWYAKRQSGMAGAISRKTSMQLLYRFVGMAGNQALDSDIQAMALAQIRSLADWLDDQSSKRMDQQWRDHYALAAFEIEQYLANPDRFQSPAKPSAPPGSPIGDGG